MFLDRSPWKPKNGAVVAFHGFMLSQPQVLIALVVAAHAGVLAVRLGFSLFKA
jgi:photosystem I reaction center subunit XII